MKVILQCYQLENYMMNTEMLHYCVDETLRRRRLGNKIDY